MMQTYNNLSIKSLPGEIWKPIPGFPKYKASNFGRLKSFKKSPSIIRQSMNEKGYMRIGIYSKDRKKGCNSVHRAIAMAFHKNPNNHKEVNHIDGNKQNNRADNLEWCDRSHNVKHMIQMNGPGHRLGLTNPKATIVIHKEYGIFCTMREAANMSGCKEANFNNMIYGVGYRKNKTKFILT